MILLRSSLFFIGYVLLTILFGSLVLVALILPRRWAHRCMITWCQLIIPWLRLTCGVRYRVIGRENINKVLGPKVFLAKHQSSWETIFFQNLFWPASTILKRELLRIPFFGWGLGRTQPIAINRGSPLESLRQVKEIGIERIRQGYNLLLFPEGTRMPPGERGKYSRSGADIASATGVPIIPVAVNAGQCWPVRGFLKQPGLISIIIGEPIDTEGKNSRELMHIVEQWIESQMEALR